MPYSVLLPGVSTNALQRVLSLHLHNWYVHPSYIYPASQGSKACMGSDVPNYFQVHIILSIVTYDIMEEINLHSIV